MQAEREEVDGSAIRATARADLCREIAAAFLLAAQTGMLKHPGNVERVTFVHGSDKLSLMCGLLSFLDALAKLQESDG